MSAQPRYRCFCKATRDEDGSPRRSFNWVVARRGWFTIFDDRVECGDWTIPFSQVQQAIVYRGKQLFIPATVLHLGTADADYQFGFNPWASPIAHLPLEMEEEPLRLSYSPFSLIIRLGAVAYLIYYLLSK